MLSDLSISALSGRSFFVGIDWQNKEDNRQDELSGNCDNILLLLSIVRITSGCARKVYDLFADFGALKQIQ